jgi:hypothetical protein
MKIASRLLPLVLALGVCRGAQLTTAPLSVTTAVQTAPDAAAPAIGYLKAGTEPVSAGPAPEGWMAVALPGPFSGYVKMGDFTKQLDVVPGSSIYLKPDASSPVLTKAAKGDKLEITGLHGKWTQIALNQPVMGYIHAGPMGAAAIASADPTAPGPSPDAPISAATPTAPAAPAPATTGREAAPENAASASIVRIIEGKFVAAHKLFAKRPYQWELADSTGTRLAYLDVSKLLLTEQLDRYIDRQVSVTGAVEPVPKSEDVVVRVENLQLK